MARKKANTQIEKEELFQNDRTYSNSTNLKLKQAD